MLSETKTSCLASLSPSFFPQTMKMPQMALIFDAGVMRREDYKTGTLTVVHGRWCALAKCVYTLMPEIWTSNNHMQVLGKAYQGMVLCVKRSNIASIIVWLEIKMEKVVGRNLCGTVITGMGSWEGCLCNGWFWWIALLVDCLVVTLVFHFFVANIRAVKCLGWS